MKCLSCEDPTLVFVFGSNLAGRHGASAAKHARERHGARYGVGEGLQGNSYAIPTKDINIYSMMLEDIEVNSHKFVRFAIEHPHIKFNLTRIGCGLAGYKDSDIAPMFKNAPTNVIRPEGW